MRKEEVDYMLNQMLDSNKNVSDINLTIGKPPQVETFGELVPVDIKPKFNKLTPYQTEVFALNLINRDRRLTEVLLREGSCDLSYRLSTTSLTLFIRLHR
jgi:twitching motility protein PilT